MTKRSEKPTANLQMAAPLLSVGSGDDRRSGSTANDAAKRLNKDIMIAEQLCERKMRDLAVAAGGLTAFSAALMGAGATDPSAHDSRLLSQLVGALAEPGRPFHGFARFEMPVCAHLSSFPFGASTTFLMPARAAAVTLIGSCGPARIMVGARIGLVETLLLVQVCFADAFIAHAEHIGLPLAPGDAAMRLVHTLRSVPPATVGSDTAPERVRYLLSGSSSIGIPRGLRGAVLSGTT